MQNLYKPPDSELKAAEPKAASTALFFLVANSGFLIIPALVLPLFYYIGGPGYSGIYYSIVLEIILVSAGCSLLASTLLLPFRKIRLRWAAIAGSLLSIFFFFLLALFDEL